MVEYLNMSLLQIYQWVCQWKNFESRLTFGEVMGKSLVSCFLRHSVFRWAWPSLMLCFVLSVLWTVRVIPHGTGSSKIEPLTFTARRYASVVVAMALYLSVRLWLCLLQVGVPSKRLNKSSWFLSGSFLRPIQHCVLTKFGRLQK